MLSLKMTIKNSIKKIKKLSYSNQLYYPLSMTVNFFHQLQGLKWRAFSPKYSLKIKKLTLVGGALVSLFCLLSACDQESSTQKTPLKTVTDVQKNASDTPQIKIWRPLFGETAQIQVGQQNDQLVLVVRLGDPVEINNASTFVMGLLPKWPAVLVNKITLQYLEVDSTGWEVSWNLADQTRYKKGEISAPEMKRRLLVKQIDTTTSLKDKINQARQNKNLPLAEQLVTEWLTKNKGDVWGLSMLANILRDRHDCESALRIYQQLASDTHNLFAYHNMGYCYDQLGMIREAIMAYQQALLIDPTQVVLMQQLADVLVKNGAGDEARLWINRARKILDSSELDLIEGNLDRQEKKYDLALAAYDRGKNKNPVDSRFLYNQILIYLDQNKYDLARKNFTELQKSDPVLAADLAQLEVFR